MFDNSTMPGEDAGEQAHENSGELDLAQAARASEWESAMQDGVSEFSGEWAYGEPQGFAPEASTTATSETFEQNLAPNPELSGAGRITSYGFDTASRIYGLNNVLTKIYETDITANGVVQNPLGAIYQNLEPSAEGRAHLFREIQKDIVIDNEHNDDADLNTAHLPVGLTPYGDFYDKEMLQDNHEQTSIDAIVALKKLLDSLATAPRFERLRERAQAEHKSVIDLLVGDTTNPTVTTFLNGISGELSESNIEEIIEQIEDRAEELAEADDDSELGIIEDIEPPEGPKNHAETDGNSNPQAALAEEELLEQRLVDRFNQSLSNQPDPHPRAQSNPDNLSDAEFAAILEEESVKFAPGNDFDSDDIIARLKSEIPDDYEAELKRQRAAKSSEFPASDSIESKSSH